MPSADVQTLLKLYRTMVVIRRCEERLARSHQQGLIHGACHTYVGQEAIAAGVCAGLRVDDVVFSTHRGHGHALAKGMAPRDLIAELYGRESGCSRGRGGSMHLFQPEVGVMGTSGIVGPSILQACGGGYTFKLLAHDRVSVAFFGDGAVNNGAFHEGLNMASIWKLPVLFVCENNQFATEIPFEYASGSPHVGRRGEMYGMMGHEVDGNDVLAVWNVARKAIARARNGEGPTLIECQTYRTRAHAEGMSDFTYRTRDEVDDWRQRCPIQRLRHLMIDKDEKLSEALDDMEEQVRNDIESAHHFAEDSPFPRAETASWHVHARSVSVPPRVAEASSVLATEASAGRELTFMQATHEALAQAMARDETIFVLGEGIGKRGGNFNTTAGLYERYGATRLCDTPICERGFVGLACGAAMTGSRPVVDFMFADFLLDAVGEIVNQIAKMQYMSSGRLVMPVLLRGCVGIGHSAATHHSGNYHAMYARFPGLRVVLPSSPRDAKALLTHALRCHDPVLFLEHRELLTIKEWLPDQDEELEFGQARIVREGTDITVVALAKMVHEASRVADRLSVEGISVEILDPRTVAPLDIDSILLSLHKTGRLLIVDEDFVPFGVGAEIAAVAADAGFDDLDAPIRRLGGTMTPVPYSPPLEAAIVPHEAEIEQAIRDVLDE